MENFNLDSTSKSKRGMTIAHDNRPLYRRFKSIHDSFLQKYVSQMTRLQLCKNNYQKHFTILQNLNIYLDLY